MNKIAMELNNIIEKDNSFIYDMLTEIGKNLFFPRGILFQGAEAKKKAKKLNATIGIAMENNNPMHLKEAYRYFNNLVPNELFNYAPASGKEKLRHLWFKKMLIDNPTLKGKKVSLPVVTNAITHGLSISADLFVDQGDAVLIPDKFWGNYKLIFGVRRAANIIHYPLFKGNNFNIEELEKSIKSKVKSDKVVIILNFPNNPSGYSITEEEGKEIVSIIDSLANKGKKIIIINDDAYFGLFYEPEILKESLFSYFANLNERVLAIKLDGVTKEEFLWGFRTGFITLGSKKLSKKAYNALEEKIMGIIRGTISNCSMPSQSIIEKMISSNDYRKEQKEKFQILQDRYNEVKRVLKNPKYQEVWDTYPFNSGYFMCLKLKNINAEELRMRLLNKYGVGIIATSNEEIRIAFSCLNKDSIHKTFEIIYKCVKEMR
ncbi:MAG: aminotransferase class I/II-fold pyridoxal phosphate-dependent enzyme [Promethearchaeota archaeon]|nr:MAG: aminotransferase class I/II-fold pyridoxal phosphate-dependent enzyme [Candidatus Lokiarchaeota archaeon]